MKKKNPKTTNEKKLTELDKELENEDFLSFIKLSAAKYIKDNAEVFVDRG